MPWQNGDRQLLEHQPSQMNGVYVMDNSHKLQEADVMPQPHQLPVQLSIKSENSTDIKPHPTGVTVGTISDTDGRTEVKTTSNSGLLTPTNTSVISHTSQDSPDLDSSKVKTHFCLDRKIG